ncbi:sensor histidine kinase [Amycolatopsis nigrescens]|uniref:sensor histidine kinase n=1 Tax=Amycolatopsis nigrescens TaxID=381445 RepID=UPI000475FFE9|nr:ATP-binding protein [Amycolatopsis nigrescens]
MATRARELLNRSRVLLDRSREAAAQMLATPRQTGQTPPAPPRIIEAPRPRPSSGNAEEALGGICASVALRDLNLVDALLAQLEDMEEKEEDQDRLGELYRLDHLATRLRRNAENLRVLAGRDASDSVSETASVVDVVRAAMSSIDHYSRITIGRVVSLGVVGFAAEDLSRLLAELLDNAANQSPPDSAVRVSAHLTEEGSVLLRIEDEGIGLPDGRLQVINERLAADPVLDNDSVQHMGLAVVRRLADRHGMRAKLDRRSPHGTTATVLLPGSLVCELPEATWSGSQTVVLPQAGAPRKATPAPKPAAAIPRRSGTTTSSGLPRRAGGTHAPAPPRPRPTTAPSPAANPASTGTTPNGLPRRVSRSIKNADTSPPSQPSVFDEKAGHEQLIADLGAFSDGEREARAQQGDGGSEKPAEGNQQ